MTTRTIDCEVKAADEPWTKLTLTNGDKIALRTICTGVRRQLDDKGDPANSPDGKPMYLVDWQHVFVVTPKVQLDA